MSSGGHNKKYSKSFKLNAVKLAERIGAQKAARQLIEECELDVTHKNMGKLIRQWARQAGIDVSTPEDRARAQKLIDANAVSNAQRREALKAKLMDRAHSLLDYMNSRHEQWMKGQGGELELVELRRPPANAMKDYALAFGILLDKYRLEEGESTSRHETVGAKQRDEIDEELDRLASELARKAQEDNAPIPQE